MNVLKDRRQRLSVWVGAVFDFLPIVFDRLKSGHLRVVTVLEGLEYNRDVVDWADLVAGAEGGMDAADHVVEMVGGECQGVWGCEG